MTIESLLAALEACGDYHIRRKGNRYHVTIPVSGAGARSGVLSEAILKCVQNHWKRVDGQKDDAKKITQRGSDGYSESSVS